jgi:hypothetical protein
MLDRLRTDRLSRVLAAIAAGLVAVAPLAQALCAIDLHERSSLLAAAHADHHGSGDDPLCCDRLPVSMTDSRVAGDDAAGAASGHPKSFVAAPWSGLRATHAMVRRSTLAAAEPPPPEPAFRRVPRLLL